MICLVVWAGCDLSRPRASAELCQPDRPCPGITAELCAAGREATLYGRGELASGTCVARDADTCRRSELACKTWGQCSAPSASTVTTQCAEAVQRPERDVDFLASRNVLCGMGRTCVATSSDDCRAALVCTMEGRCTAKDGVCIASSEDDCRAASNCAQLGWCSLYGTRCTATRYEDCQRSRACDDWSECGIAQELQGCTACSRSLDCQNDGRCARSPVADRCIAVDEPHCMASAVCKSEGRCRASQGVCVR